MQTQVKNFNVVPEQEYVHLLLPSGAKVKVLKKSFATVRDQLSPKVKVISE